MDNFKKLSNRQLRRSVLIREGVSLIVINNSIQTEIEFTDYNKINHCFIFHYKTFLQCIKHFKKASSQENIIVLFINFDNDKIQTMLLQLKSYRQLQAVYNLQLQNEKNNIEKKHLFENESKLIQSFDQWDSLSINLQNLINETEKRINDTGLISTCNSPEKALRDLKNDLGPFVWTHTFRVLFMDMPHNSKEAKYQMLRECRKCYRHQSFQLKEIDHFEKNYRSCEAIKWYTKPGFLSSVVNKTLRSKNVYALYTFRYFIFDLCESLALMRYCDVKPFSVYRGTILHRDEVEQLKESSTVSSNGFFSSSSSRDIALIFANSDQNRSRTDAYQFVLFQINVDLNLSPDLIVADVRKESHISDEEEFLFDLGTTFIITKIFYDDLNHIWHIEMRGSNEVAERSREYDAYMHKRLLETNATILYGRMLAHISEYSLAVKHFHRLLRVLPVNHEDRPNIHYQLARMYRFLGKHQQAIHYFLCAKLLYRHQLPHKSYEYGMVLAGLGTVYMELNDSKRALIVLERASIYYSYHSNEYNTETIFHFNRLSYAYYLEQQYERALELINKTMNYYKTKMPADHPGHAQTYHNLGLVQRAMGKRDEAFVSFKEALRMREVLLASTHPYVARTCYQISLLLEECKDYPLALQFATKALRIQQVKLPSDHSELILSSELVTKLTILNNETV